MDYQKIGVAPRALRLRTVGDPLVDSPTVPTAFRSFPAVLRSFATPVPLPLADHRIDSPAGIGCPGSLSFTRPVGSAERTLHRRHHARCLVLGLQRARFDFAAGELVAGVSGGHSVWPRPALCARARAARRDGG